MDAWFPGQQSLDAFLPRLADDPRIKEAIVSAFPRSSRQITEYLKASNTQALIASGAYDRIAETVQDDAAVVGVINALGTSAPGEEDPFDVEILQFGPVFWIEAPQFDPLGYFASLELASAAAELNYEPYISAYQSWVEAVDDDGDPEDDDEENEESGCPYCAGQSCEHHLLTVDLLFRGARGGMLYKEFLRRWTVYSTIGEAQDGDDFDEREAFEACLEDVAALADTEVEYDFEGGPGQSTTYRAYYCSSAERVAAAVSAFAELRDPA